MASNTPPARPARRPASVSSVATNAAQRSPPAPSSNPSGTTLVAKGSISRSSPTPKVQPPVRRSTASSRPSSSLSNPRDGSRAKSPENGLVLPGNPIETEAEIGSNDELRLRMQDLNNTVSNLAADNAKLQTSLTQTENRLNELYADQARMDNELAVRHELAEKLRSQLRELEKEKRELTRRYNEQTTAFEAERQSFYDNEQHLKSRIQALTQTRREVTSPRKQRHADLDDNISIVSEVEFPPPAPQPTSGEPKGTRRRGETINASNAHYDSDDNDPAEMTSLKLELATLSTSHASLQSTLHLLQSQLQDLKRVNSELQEENEGWKVLVQQRTLAGTFDILGLGGAQHETKEKEKEKERTAATDETSSMKSGRNALEKVSEMEEIAYEAEIAETSGSLEGELARSGAITTKKRDASPESHHSKRRRSTISSDTHGSKGESLADLPITGPGLDLAAELGRAQNAEGFIDGNMASTNQKQLSPDEKRMKSEIDSLKSEIKNLKDANKALSLYASKIIDRIIATEGFENVLAVDFQDRGNKKTDDSGAKRSRPGSLMFGVDGVLPDGPRTAVPTEKLTTFESIGLSGPAVSTPAPSNVTPVATPSKPRPPPADDPRRSRRSLSFDWRGFSLFGGTGPTEAEKKANDPSLRPLTLRPGAPSLTNPSSTARKLETTEDEEDRRERERLRATMRLMGIDPAKENSGPVGGGDYTYMPPKPMNANPVTSSKPMVSPSPNPPPSMNSNRWSWFGRKNTNETPGSTSASTSSISIVSPYPAAPLTAEALQQAEAESHLAALDARERVVKEEIAKGSASGFTELSGLDGAPRKRIGEEWRSRRGSPNFINTDIVRSNSVRKPGSSAGSASTVWSAGKDED